MNKQKGGKFETMKHHVMKPRNTLKIQNKKKVEEMRLSYPERLLSEEIIVSDPESLLSEEMILSEPDSLLSEEIIVSDPESLLSDIQFLAELLTSETCLIYQKKIFSFNLICLFVMWFNRTTDINVEMDNDVKINIDVEMDKYFHTTNIELKNNNLQDNDNLIKELQEYSGYVDEYEDEGYTITQDEFYEYKNNDKTYNYCYYIIVDSNVVICYNDENSDIIQEPVPQEYIIECVDILNGILYFRTIQIYFNV